MLEFCSRSSGFECAAVVVAGGDAYDLCRQQLIGALIRPVSAPTSRAKSRRQPLPPW